MIFMTEPYQLYRIGPIALFLRTGPFINIFFKIHFTVSKIFSVILGIRFSSYLFPFWTFTCSRKTAYKITFAKNAKKPTLYK